MPAERSEPEAEPWWLTPGPSTIIRGITVQKWTSVAWSMLRNSQNLAPPLVDERGVRIGIPWMRTIQEEWGDADPFTLTVFHPFFSTKNLTVRKAVWRRSFDVDRLWKPVDEREVPKSIDPTVTVADALVPRGELEEILHSGLNLHLPLLKLTYPDSVTSGCASLGFEFFTLNQPQSGISFTWSFDPPSEWQPAIDFVTRLQTFLESCLGKSS